MSLRAFAQSRPLGVCLPVSLVRTFPKRAVSNPLAFRFRAHVHTHERPQLHSFHALTSQFSADPGGRVPEKWDRQSWLSVHERIAATPVLSIASALFRAQRGVGGVSPTQQNLQDSSLVTRHSPLTTSSYNSNPSYNL